MPEVSHDSLSTSLSTSRGAREAEAAFAQADGDLAQFTRKLGIRGLSFVVRQVLDEHYPADIFGDGGALYPAWGGPHGGDDIDPGIKWCALLRKALSQVPDDPE